jgi:hypothetical protein
MNKMKNQFIPSEILVEEWKEKSFQEVNGEKIFDYNEFVKLAAQWGADRELDACCSVINEEYERWFETTEEDYTPMEGEDLYDMRRPKTMKQKIIEALDRMVIGEGMQSKYDAKEYIFIRKHLFQMEEENFELGH